MEVKKINTTSFYVSGGMGVILIIAGVFFLIYMIINILFNEITLIIFIVLILGGIVLLGYSVKLKTKFIEISIEKQKEC